MIRFHIHNPDAEPIATEWAEEVFGDVSIQTAAIEVAKLRRDHPNAAISLERSSIIPRKKQHVVRFKIQEKDNLTYYSMGFPIELRDEQLLRLQKKHPDAEITAEERYV